MRLKHRQSDVLNLCNSAKVGKELWIVDNTLSPSLARLLFAGTTLGKSPSLSSFFQLRLHA
jgi:hypothetical protein